MTRITTVDEIRKKFSLAIIDWDDVAPEAPELGLFVAKFCFDILNDREFEIERLQAQVKRLTDENGIDALLAEAANLDRDRAKAEAQRAEQERDEALALLERPTFDELEHELNERWNEYGDCSKQAQYVISLFESRI